MANVNQWERVPDGSTLHVKVDLGTGSIDGFFAESNSDGRPLSQDELRQGIDFPLRTPQRYSIGLVIRFANQSTFTVRGSITKPDGTIHGKRYEESLTAGAGNVKIVALVAKTKT